MTAPATITAPVRTATPVEEHSAVNPPTLTAPVRAEIAVTAPAASTRSVADAPRRARSVAATLRTRLPFTTVMTAVILLGGVATGALWSPVTGRSWFPQAAYGLPGLEHGCWWALLTGAFLALSPVYYLPMTGAVVSMVGLAEWRLGTRRAAAAAVGGHAVGVLGAALVLVAARGTGWPWAAAVSGHLDVGFSGGALAALAVTTAAMTPFWRVRLRAALCLYVAIAFLCVGSLADLVHLIAVAVGLPAGRHLAGTAGARVRPGRREWRLAAALGIAAIAAASTLAWLVPAGGPLGAGDGQTSWPDVVIVVGAAALLANGLRRGRRVAWRWAVGLSTLNVLVGLAVPVAVTVGASAAEGLPQFVASRLLWAGLLVVLVAGRRAFHVPSRRRGLPGHADRRTATDLLQRWGGGTLSWMTTWPANIHFRTRDGHSTVAYQVHAGVAVTVGDPVGPVTARTAALAEFARMSERSGTVPALFSVSGATARAAAGMGWRHVQVAEDTIVELEGLAFRGKSWQDVRSALNRAVKEGVTFRLTTLAEEPAELVDRLREVSGAWAGEKGMPEMGFTLGGIDEALDPHVRVGIAEGPDGVVHGVTSWLPVYGEHGQVRGWTLDVMRRRHGGFRPVVEFLIASGCLAFQAEGAAFVSLSGAPLARSAAAAAPTATEHLLDLLGAGLEPLYGFRSLHAFKAKFHPTPEPLYLVYRDEADLPRIGIALARAYLPQTTTRDLIRLGARVTPRRGPIAVAGSSGR